MTDLIVFSVGENKYAMNIENVQRIIESTSLTSIPNAHQFIDGMMSYEDKVIKVLNFRKLIEMNTSELDLVSDSLVSDSLEKLIIYDKDGAVFAIKVDTIEDIAHVEESDFRNSAEQHEASEFLELDNVLDLDGVLINVIKTIKLPK
ncbi:MAG TPA: chemotaxis protein CheW [Sulfurimonas sp.]|nr:chemotaxis protein CheW [Sulfurimonas sp.]